MKEKLQEYALIAEIISAIAVVAGLIFVGLQIGQSNEETALNTRAVEVAAYQDLIGQILDINEAVMTDPELMDVILRGQAGELTDPNENGRYLRYNASLGRHADMACFQFQKGIIDQARLAAMLNIYYGQVIRLAQDTNQLIMTAAPGLQDCLDLVKSDLEQSLPIVRP